MGIPYTVRQLGLKCHAYIYAYAAGMKALSSYRYLNLRNLPTVLFKKLIIRVLYVLFYCEFSRP